MSDIDTASTRSDPQSPSIYPTEFSTTIDPTKTTFAEMTYLLDNIRNTFFLPLFNSARQIPALRPIEVVKLSKIASILCRYDRAPALDPRGEWPFLAIAGRDEVFVAEVLLGLFFGQRVVFADVKSSGRANEAIWFLSAIQKRLPLF